MFAVCLSLWLAIPASTVGAPAPVTNLLQNPGAEAGPGYSLRNGGPPPPDWSVTGQMTAEQYGAAGGFPGAAVGAAINGGKNFFAGGTSHTSTGSQTVDVSGDAAAIDANTAVASLSGDLGGIDHEEDNMVVVATYLSAAGGTLGSLTIGPVTEADRRGQTTLLPRSNSGPVPSGTRSIRVVMTATLEQGAYNDGYADNLSLSLGTGSTTTSPSPVLYGSEVAAPVSGKVFVELPPGAAPAQASESESKGASFVALTQPRQIPVGSIFDTRSGTVGLTAASPTSGQFYTGTFTAGVFQLLQNRAEQGLSQLTLMDSLDRRKGCASAGKPAAAARKNVGATVLGLLKSTDHGKFSTRGAYSAATVRGTAYSVADTCAGTLTTVTRGSVVVDYFRRHQRLVVYAGHAFLAKASGGPSTVVSVGK